MRILCSPETCYFHQLPVPVAVLEDPTNITHLAGGNISLSCTFFGDLYLKVVWFKNGTLIGEDDEHTFTNNTVLEENVNGIVMQSFLRIHNLSYADDTEYLCQGSNQGAVGRNVFLLNSTSAHVTVQC